MLKDHLSTHIPSPKRQLMPPPMVTLPIFLNELTMGNPR